MKNITYFLFGLLLTTKVQGQVLKHYTAPQADITFTCITPATNSFFLVGTYSDAAKKGVYILKVNSGGTVINHWIIQLDDYPNTDIYPRAIWHSVLTNEIVIAGHIGANLDISHAFIFSYDLDYATGGMNWVNILDTPYSSFLDMQLVMHDDVNEFILCGQLDGGDSNEDAAIFRVPHSGGGIFIEEVHDANSQNVTSDTHYALTITNDFVGLAGRFEPVDGINNRRPTLTTYDLVTHITGDVDDYDYYNAPAGQSARFYCQDIQRRNSQYIMVITGDETGTGLYRNNYLLRTNLMGDISLFRQIDRVGVSDGNLQAVRIYEPGGHMAPAYIMYGSTDDNSDQTLDRAMLISMSSLGTINWSLAIDNMSCHNPSCANSMIISGTNIYAVGWYDDNGKKEGALLVMNVNGASFTENGTGLPCSEVLDLNLLTETDHIEAVMDYPNDAIEYSTSDDDEYTHSVSDNVICYDNGRISQPDLQTQESIVIDNSTDATTINLLNGFEESHYEIILFDLSGRKILECNIANSLSIAQEIPTGIYSYILLREGEKILSDKIFIY